MINIIMIISYTFAPFPLLLLSTLFIFCVKRKQKNSSGDRSPPRVAPVSTITPARTAKMAVVKGKQSPLMVLSNPKTPKAKSVDETSVRAHRNSNSASCHEAEPVASLTLTPKNTVTPKVTVTPQKTVTPAKEQDSMEETENSGESDEK